MRVHAEHTGRHVLLWHPTCHLQLHEDQSVSRLHGLSPRPVGDAHRVLTIDDLEGVAEYAAVLLIELPQREIGGQLPDWNDLVAQTELARSHGTALPLDGARLLECLPHYLKTAIESDLLRQANVDLAEARHPAERALAMSEEKLRIRSGFLRMEGDDSVPA